VVSGSAFVSAVWIGGTADAKRDGMNIVTGTGAEVTDGNTFRAKAFEVGICSFSA
jgi:hypothetical protein